MKARDDNKPARQIWRDIFHACIPLIGMFFGVAMMFAIALVGQEVPRP